MYKPEYIKEILLDNKTIVEGIDKAAVWLTNKYKNNSNPPIIICILKGALQFYSHLIEKIECEIRLDFTTLSSYRNALVTNGMPEIVTNLSMQVTGRDVVVVEDVSDTANTLSMLLNNLKLQKPKSLVSMVLVDKPECRKKPFKPDYACFTLKGNPFVVGYGMDCNEKGRNLPYIAVFNPDWKDK